MKFPEPQLPKPLILGGEDFNHAAFRMYWEANQANEPERYYSIREAIQKLKEFGRLTREDLACHLSISISFMGQIESGRSTPNPAHYGKLRDLAESFSLIELARFFDDCEYKAANSQGPTRGRKPKHGGKGALPDWRDMMGV